jgi:hypothetical protein
MDNQQDTIDYNKNYKIEGSSETLREYSNYLKF